jgi:hypothetical protein
LLELNAFQQAEAAASACGNIANALSWHGDRGRPAEGGGKLVDDRRHVCNYPLRCVDETLFSDLRESHRNVARGHKEKTPHETLHIDVWAI